MIIKLLVDGGAMKPGPALSQKLGPLGMNVNMIIQKVNESTKSFAGIQVPVELNIDAGTKEFDVKVFSPPVSGLLKKELGIELGSGTQKKVKVGNASIEQIISVAKTKFPNLLCKDFKSAVKTIVGTCVTLGILIENKTPVEIEKEIDEGKYDKEISNMITETPAEKKKELAEYFSKVKKEQDKILQQEQAAKVAEEAAKTAATTTAPAAVAATPAKKE
ncbi:50S ribosomal protein L11 [Candidatus Pacearchaeota archaeon]|nr:50S ribosomal protein L11 [Candidatus Pacearchaeota archaeon]